MQHVLAHSRGLHGRTAAALLPNAAAAAGAPLRWAHQNRPPVMASRARPPASSSAYCPDDMRSTSTSRKSAGRNRQVVKN